MECSITTKFIDHKSPKVEIWALEVWGKSIRRYFVVDYRSNPPSIKFFKTLKGARR